MLGYMIAPEQIRRIFKLRSEHKNPFWIARTEHIDYRTARKYCFMFDAQMQYLRDHPEATLTRKEQEVYDRVKASYELVELTKEEIERVKQGKKDKVENDRQILKEANKIVEQKGKEEHTIKKDVKSILSAIAAELRGG